MTSILVDPEIDDLSRRRHLFDGDLVVYRPTQASSALCDFARGLIAEAFAPLEPERAQHELPVQEYAGILSRLKPLFIHHEESKRHIRSLLREIGCDEERTYFDVPRLRSSTSHGYLTTGIAYAFHPHRDTWYSAPMCQVNVWMPVYAVEPGNIMAFHPQYWSAPVPNNSADYDYQRWNATSRFNAAQHIGADTRVQPKPQVPVEVTPDLRVVTPVGGIKMFSAAHLHSSLPNQSGRTRFSIDFRVVNLDDVIDEAGAPNVDSHCSGTALCDFLRVSDLQRIDPEVVARYIAGHPQAPGHRATVRA